MLSTILKHLYTRSLVIQDETSTGSILNRLKIKLRKERLTVRELIRERVFQEVAQYNVQRPLCYHGLIAPAGAEPVLNGYRLLHRHKIDPEQHFYRTMDAFYNKNFCILVDELRLDDPEHPIVVRPHTRVSFLKLMCVA
ncbi:MAG: hypothetical protein D6730_12620 [Bacteroidetes bacterium]|nr:MAG: hypothetical protein D6730_12620 [Bacteroidota bacterium]